MIRGLTTDQHKDLDEFINNAVKTALQVERIINTPLMQDVKSIMRDDTDDDNTSSDELIPMDDENSDDDTEEETTPMYKRVILTTDAPDIETHDAIINRFNFKYKTNERGSNGSAPRYFTHGETDYDLNSLCLLKLLYTNEVNKLIINNVSVFLTFENSTERRHKTNLFNNFVGARDDDKYIILPRDYDFRGFLEETYIKNKVFYKNSQLIMNDDYNEGDIIYINDAKCGKYTIFYQVVKITNVKIGVRPLTPIITAKQDGINHKSYLFKYRINNIDYTTRLRYFNKKTFNYRYILDDYIYMSFFENC
jgi:hypothetical protein